MRSLISFLWKNNNFFLFLFLEVSAFYLIVANSKFHNTGFFNSSNYISANVYHLFDDVTGYINLKKSNQLLAQENARLLSQSTSSFIENISFVTRVEDSSYKQKYTYQEAKVINNSVNRRNNYITLDKGSNHGIKPLMGVIAPDGIVGIVKDVSDNFCTVLSLLHKSATISSKIKKSGYLGSVVWEGGDSRVVTMYDVPKHAVLIIGDTVVTSGASAIFPDNVSIGIIEDIYLKEGNNFYIIKLNLFTDFARLSYVYVVDNLMKQEQYKLEEKTQNDN
ncbi:MAG: rod shape-determining protein MreC [Bacteroidetes bacterium]|nr:rod shape-determining protein MreC [Bacteroidota bacterium]HET6243470.1 rod shape-determining protein MreC [Bacteroidia bacterium]